MARRRTRPSPMAARVADDDRPAVRDDRRLARPARGAPRRGPNPRPRAGPRRRAVRACRRSRPTLITGAGFVAAPGCLADAQWHLAWWLRRRAAARGGSRPIDDPGPSSSATTRRSSGGACPRARGAPPHGTYVDYVCTDDYAVTITTPVRLGGEMVGLVGIDALVDRLEHELLPVLRAGGTHDSDRQRRPGRVVTSTDARREPGSMLRLAIGRPGLPGASRHRRAARRRGRRDRVGRRRSSAGGRRGPLGGARPRRDTSRWQALRSPRERSETKRRARSQLSEEVEVLGSAPNAIRRSRIAAAARSYGVAPIISERAFASLSRAMTSKASCSTCRGVRRISPFSAACRGCASR